MDSFKMNPCLRQFWKTRADTKVLKGGRASGKTWDTAANAVYLASEYSLRFLCLRQFQNNINDSVYTVLKKMIELMGYAGEFEILQTTIRHKVTGSEFIFYGFQRNTSSIKGTEGVDVCWIEEAESLSKAQWEIVEPTIRKEHSCCWIVYNPRMSSDFVEEYFVDDPDNGVIVRKINYDENPFLSNTMKRKIERARKSDIDNFNHIYLGVPLSDDEQSVIKRSWVEAAIDAHLHLNLDMSGRVTVGYDIADSGDDRNCAAVFNGAICENLDTWKAGEDQLRQSAIRAKSHAADDGFLIYDSIGVGAHAGSTLNAIGFKKHERFNAGGSVAFPDRKTHGGIANKDKYENLKAQAWFDVADRFRNTFNAVNNGESFPSDQLISISSKVKDLEKLKTELCAPHKDYSRRGLDQVESKKEVKKRLERSHDLADAFIMGASVHLIRQQKAFKLNRIN